MIEKYYAGDEKLKPCLCYRLRDSDTDDFDSAIKDLQRGNIRWAVWSWENGQKRMKFVLYRDRKGLTLKERRVNLSSTERRNK